MPRLKKVNLIYPDTRRHTGNLSTNKLPGLATAHAGLPILAEIIEKKGYDVKVFDEKICPPPEEELYDCDMLGISIQTSTSVQGYRLAAEAKKRGVPVVFGGAHATLNPEEVLTHGDFVVRNEGEETFPELLGSIAAGTSPVDVKGVSWWDNGKPVHNKVRPFLQNLNSVPRPDLNRIHGLGNPLLKPLNRIFYFTQATRGCPFDCTFCSIIRTFGREMRVRDPVDVAEEIKECMLPSHQILFFHDDSLAGDKEYLKELLATMIRRKALPKTGWHSQMRSDIILDKDLIRLMKESRCLAATFGFESINPKTLKYMQKGQSVEMIKKCIKTMHENDIFVIGFFVFGSDHDDISTIRETTQFAIDEGVDFAGFMPMTPFPGTPFYSEMEKASRIFSRDWELYDVQHVVYWPKNMGPQELYRETLRCYDRFYANVFPESRMAKINHRAANAFGYGLGVLWPVLKRYDYRMELAANRDYLQALDDLETGKIREFPVLSNQNLGAKDFVSGRWLRPYTYHAANFAYKTMSKVFAA